MTIEQAISEAVSIKHQIDELKSRYTDLQAESLLGFKSLTGSAPGMPTPEMSGRASRSWRNTNGTRTNSTPPAQRWATPAFLKAFTFEWKPVDKKTIDIFLSKYATPEQQALITDAMTVERRTALSFTGVPA